MALRLGRIAEGALGQLGEWDVAPSALFQLYYLI